MSTATATVRGGFWETNGVGSLASMSGEDGQRRDVRMRLGEKGMMAIREIMFVLTGAAPGANATKNYTAVAPSVELGGLRTIETQVLVNRATTAADVSEIQQELLRFVTKNTFGANPPPNLDRNPLGTR
jgi:hypothetical protein